MINGTLYVILAVVPVIIISIFLYSFHNVFVLVTPVKGNSSHDTIKLTVSVICLQ